MRACAVIVVGRGPWQCLYALLQLLLAVLEEFDERKRRYTPCLDFFGQPDGTLARTNSLRSSDGTVERVRCFCLGCQQAVSGERETYALSVS